MTMELHFKELFNFSSAVIEGEGERSLPFYLFHFESFFRRFVVAAARLLEIFFIYFHFEHTKYLLSFNNRQIKWILLRKFFYFSHGADKIVDSAWCTFTQFVVHTPTVRCQIGPLPNVCLSVCVCAVHSAEHSRCQHINHLTVQRTNYEQHSTLCSSAAPFNICYFQIVY